MAAAVRLGRAACASRDTETRAMQAEHRAYLAYAEEAGVELARRSKLLARLERAYDKTGVELPESEAERAAASAAKAVTERGESPLQVTAARRAEHAASARSQAKSGGADGDGTTDDNDMTYATTSGGEEDATGASTAEEQTHQERRAFMTWIAEADQQQADLAARTAEARAALDALAQSDLIPQRSQAGRLSVITGGSKSCTERGAEIRKSADAIRAAPADHPVHEAAGDLDAVIAELDESDASITALVARLEGVVADLASARGTAESATATADSLTAQTETAGEEITAKMRAAGDNVPLLAGVAEAMKDDYTVRDRLAAQVEIALTARRRAEELRGDLSEVQTEVTNKITEETRRRTSVRDRLASLEASVATGRFAAEREGFETKINAARAAADVATRDGRGFDAEALSLEERIAPVAAEIDALGKQWATYVWPDFFFF
jgi:hypothetical protein